MTSDSAVYAIGTLIGQASSLVTFPLYTRVLGVEAYGVFALLMAFVSVGRSLLVLGMNTAMIRFYVGADEDDRPRIVGTSMTFILVVGLACIGAGLLWSDAILSLITSSHSVSGTTITAVSVALATDIVVEMLLALARARRSPGIYVIANAARVIVTLIAVSVLLAFGAGVPGAFIGLAIGNVSGGLILAIALHRFLSFEMRVGFLRTMLGFGVGLVPANLASWALDVADRYVIERFLGFAAVGLYSAGYRVGSLVTVALVLPFHTAFLPSMFQAVKDGVSDEFIERTARYYTAIVGIAVIGLCAVGPELLRLFAGAQYAQGAIVIGPVAFGCALAGSVSVFGPGILIKGKTHLSAIVFLGAAVINVVANILVVPRLGFLGAAIVTAVTYLMLAIAYVYVSHHVFPVTMDVQGMLLGSTVVLVVVVATMVIGHTVSDEWTSLALRIGSALAGVGALFGCRVITPAELYSVAHDLYSAFVRRLART